MGTNARPAKPSHWGVRLAWLVVSAIVVAAVWKVDLDWASLWHLPAETWRFLGLMFTPPAWAETGKAIEATIDSIQMAWVGTVIAAVISLPLGFLAAANVAPRVVRYPLRVVFDIIRAIPELVLAVIILSVTGLTPFTGALAIGIHSIGTLGKWTFEAVENAETGPVEAATAAGANRSQMVRWGLWPQVLPEILSFWLYRFEVNVRAGAVLGLIGAGGVGQMLDANARYHRWDVIGMLLIVVVVATIVVDLLSGTMRTKIITGRWPWQATAHVAEEALTPAV